jgi:hypothetical protein
VFELLIKVIPLGIGSTISPVVFGIALTLLAGKHYPKQRTFAYLLGAVITVVILAVVGMLIGSGSVAGAALAPSASIDVLIGFLLIIFGIRALTAKPKGEKPGVALGHEKASPQLAKWFLIGFIVNITNFDAVVLNVTAVKEIFGSGAGPSYEIILTIICDLLFLLPVLLPIFVYLLMPNTARKILEPIRSAAEKYGKYILVLIFFIFGIYMLSKGLPAYI